MLYFDPSKARKLRMQSRVVIGTSMVTVFALFVAVFLGKLQTNRSTAEVKKWGMWLTPPINAMIIIFMDSKYQKIAIWLTERENHRTDIQFQDNLIAKLAVFQVNKSCGFRSCFNPYSLPLFHFPFVPHHF